MSLSVAKLWSHTIRSIRRWPILRGLLMIPLICFVIFVAGILCLNESARFVYRFIELTTPTGFIDHQGKFAFHLRNAVSLHRNFSNGMLVCGFSLIDKQGGEIGPKNLIARLDCTEGLACVRMRNGLVGFLDAQGRFIIPPRYTQALSFSEGLAAVLIDDQWGYIDRDGKQVIAAQFDKVLPFSEGLACVSINGKINYIDHTGRVVIKTKFDMGASFVEERAVMGSVNCDGSLGRVVCANKNGDVVFESNDQKTFAPTQDNLLRLPTNGQPDLAWLDVRSKQPGVEINETDLVRATIVRNHNESSPSLEKPRLQIQFLPLEQTQSKEKIVYGPLFGSRPLSHFSNGLLLIKSRASQGKYGYVDLNGQLVIPAQFQTAFEFSEGLAAASAVPKSNGGNGATLFGFIDKSGAFRIPPQFESASGFHEGLARVRRPGAGDEFIDRSGKVVLVAPDGEAGDFNDGLAPVGKEQYCL